MFVLTMRVLKYKIKICVIICHLALRYDVTDSGWRTFVREAPTDRFLYSDLKISVVKIFFHPLRT